MATAFASSDELASMSNDESLDSLRGVLLLEQASAVIQTYCRQTFDRVVDDEVELRGTWAGRLQLPERPVESVSAVAVDGTAIDDYRRVRDVLFRGRQDAWNVRNKSSRGHWGGPESVVTVTYTHGWEIVPGAVKAVCLQVAARAAVNPRAATQESIGDWSASWGSSGGGFALTMAEQSILDRFRHEHAA